MKQILLRLLIKALTIYYLFPKIHNIVIHGNFFTAIILAILFTFTLWLVETAIVFASTLMTLYTLGLALLLLIPLWLIGFWLIPVFALKLVSHYFPEYIQIIGWIPAIYASLLLMAVSLLTGSLKIVISCCKR